ncbi:EamA family transporter [Iningainema tapete]|uniref:EamA family transporter n=1 Tax=Iningainema tapete BLCC-T55 TaxID=2748662 RepID=A0A8J6XQW7_9CYAN|nr:EamA family transporter [Iningainema tapete]MBD2774907.1 EamA family transporter [Iningainema tapete BLCC-T55]
MTLPEFILLLISVIASVAGQLFLKMGAMKLGRVNVGNFVNLILGIVTNHELIFGLTCYGFGAVAYILLLTRVNLSIAAPSASLVYVFSVLLGYFIFRESIPLVRFVGLSFIVTGVILVIWRK